VLESHTAGQPEERSPGLFMIIRRLLQSAALPDGKATRAIVVVRI
jgi:hypothetical protein